jgi:hypothetical protein
VRTLLQKHIQKSIFDILPIENYPLLYLYPPLDCSIKMDGNFSTRWARAKFEIEMHQILLLSKKKSESIGDRRII